MDFVVTKRDLLRLVSRCHGVADKKSAMPQLANVLLTAENGEIRVAATDLYLAVSGKTSAEIAKPGSIAVNAKDLFERVKAMPDGPIHVTANKESACILKAVGSPRRYTLHGLPGSEFPSLPKPAVDAESFDITVDVLALLMARTHFSISTDETRAHVNSALFEIVPGKASMVSTDGHRLSLMTVDIDVALTTSMLIPLKAIGELRRLTDEAKGDKETPTIRITQSGPNAHFEIARMQFSVKLVDAQFPPYGQVIPKTSDTTVTAPRLALMDAVRSVSLAANDRTGGIKLTFTKSAIRITSESPESGAGFDEVPIDGPAKETTVGFNAKYLLDVLSAIDDTEVVIGCKGELDPITIRPSSELKGHRYSTVVMPMRI